MEDPRWLRLITIGLVLAAIAVGYFLFTGRFASNNTTNQDTQISQESPSLAVSPGPTAASTPNVLGQNVGVAPAASPVASPTPQTAYNALIDRTKGGQPIQTLPNTGFPLGVVVTLAVSVMMAGWGLRRFPH